MEEYEMNVLIKGTAICEGITRGKICIYQRQNTESLFQQITNIKEEKLRFISVIERMKENRLALYHKVINEIGEDKAVIFKGHQLILEDPEFEQSIVQLIEEGNNAAYAVSKISENIIAEIKSLDDEYLSQRWTDIQEISQELLDDLKGNKQLIDIPVDEKVILVAEDLTASELMNLPMKSLQGIVLMHGSFTSHMAILAQSRGIPTIIQADVTLYGALKDLDGYESLLWADQGYLYVNPSEEKVYQVIEEHRQMKAFNTKEGGLSKDIMTYLEKQKIGSCCKEYKPMKLCLNINSKHDLEDDILGDGIGLLRTEFLYLNQTERPTEEEQFQIYHDIISKMGNRWTIIRTFDLGSDKTVEFMRNYQEENPSLGMRGIRRYKEEEWLLKDQLRAIYRAAAFGPVGLMIPMVISVEEVRWMKDRMAEVRKELETEEIPYGNIPFGIMIETPAAALSVKELGKEADFFSIGSNDLAQYILAIDRQSHYLAKEYQHNYMVVLKLIHRIVEESHAMGIPVGICGQMGQELRFVEFFSRIGVDYLSVSPNRVEGIRRRLEQVNLLYN